MSDPNYTDPRLAPPLREEVRRDQRRELESSNAMWGWVAGGIVLALVLMFVFSNTGRNTSSTADNGIPPASTTNAPPRVPPPAAQALSPSTSAQGNSATTNSTTGSGGSNNP
jgi:hypothetical protein